MTDTGILDGKITAAKVIESVAEAAQVFLKKTGRRPKLAVIHAGSNPASSVYVRNKQKACDKAGIEFEMVALPDTVDFSSILDAIDTLNHSDECDGLIVQLPLPSPDMDENTLLTRISIEKDVDGFHPETIGKLWSGSGDIAPCTPAGIIELLHRYAIPLKGQSAVIIGRSNIVGKPLAALLLREHATVTIAHSRTVNLPELCHSANILIAAVGRPGLVTRNYIKECAVVIDVGINRVKADDVPSHWLNPDTSIGSRLKKKGTALVGDVDPFAAQGHAKWVTPVPGGVGPMTVSMLLSNTVKMAFRRMEINQE
jgi:methylenetetrahydrofolate dehydrogenase (NADP+) / methenyltetrahydrofolate cyclohydrolase